jgi:hypothetical protein
VDAGVRPQHRLPGDSRRDGVAVRGLADDSAELQRAKVLAIGEAAMTTWNLLTEAPATAKRPCPDLERT